MMLNVALLPYIATFNNKFLQIDFAGELDSF